MNWPTPDAASGRLPLKGATPAARQSRIRGVHLLKSPCCALAVEPTR